MLLTLWLVKIVYSNRDEEHIQIERYVARLNQRAGKKYVTQ